MFTGKFPRSLNIFVIFAPPPPGFFGDPYGRRGCRRECETHSDCSRDRACSAEYKCVDPCRDKAYGVCGENARCDVKNHNAICTCFDEYTGNPFERCYLRECFEM